MDINQEIEPSVALENVTAISAEAPLKMRENTPATSAFRADSAGVAITSGFSGISLSNARKVSWSSTGNWYDTSDVSIVRSAANILGITNGGTGGGAIEFTEMTAPATPAADKARIFARDNGSGKTQVCIILPDGVVTVLATQT